MDTWVEGYHRKDGTYVVGHYRRKKGSGSTFGSSYSSRSYGRGTYSNKGRFTSANLRKYYKAWYG